MKYMEICISILQIILKNRKNVVIFYIYTHFIYDSLTYFYLFFMPLGKMNGHQFPVLNMQGYSKSSCVQSIQVNLDA